MLLNRFMRALFTLALLPTMSLEAVGFQVRPVSAEVLRPQPIATPHGIVHQYPLPGANEVSPQTSIGIRTSQSLAAGDARLKIVVHGSRSGLHQGTIQTTQDKKLLSFR